MNEYTEQQKKLIKSMERAGRIVNSWPKWKQSPLGINTNRKRTSKSHNIEKIKDKIAEQYNDNKY